MEEKYMQMIIENNQSVKSAHKRLDKLESDVGEIKELTIAVKEIAMETKALREDNNEMNNRLKKIEEKPCKNWDKLSWLIISGIATSIIGFLLGKILI